MTPAENVISKMGGTRKAAAILNTHPSTVQSWKESGFIPARRQREVLDVARCAGIKLCAEDFLPPTPVEAAPAAAQRSSPQVDHPTQSAAGPQ